MAEIAFDHVTKEFPGETIALDDLTLSVPDGEFLILVGPSGCGKTTALRIVAGLEKPTSGVISIGGEAMNAVSPRDRDIAMVFQNYALYPHMTVYRNLAFGLKERHTPKAEIERRVREASSILGLDQLLKRRPAQLSGGQRQRVAMGRALARSPKVFLLDEPLSNLDAQLRTQLRAELKLIHLQFPTTSIYVTHDQIEAMTLGDRIAVMNDGKLLQLGTPDEIYRDPQNLFVAGFIGSPPMNLLRGVSVGGQVRAGDLHFEMSGVPDGEVVVGLRPEALSIRRGGDATSVPVRVDVVEALGHELVMHGSLAGQRAAAQTDEEIGLAPLDESRATLIVRLGAREPITVGDTIELAFAEQDVHIFDATTGDVVPTGSSAARASG